MKKKLFYELNVIISLFILFKKSKLITMNWIFYFIWVIAFILGVIVAYFVPESTLPINAKFIFVGFWGAALGAVLVTILSKKETNLSDPFNFPKPETELIPIVPRVEEAPPVIEPPIQQKKTVNTVIDSLIFPTEAWNHFCRKVLKNRPFYEAIDSLASCLPQMFQNASGILYMYSGEQTELHKIIRFGKNVIGDDVITPAECASFHIGDIVVTDFSNELLSPGCTHLHHRPKGFSFCAPLEAAEEHFGILTLQVDEIPQGETPEFWKVKLSVVTATLGLYVANQNLNLKFQEHSIRDTLTGVFNRRYMEESLQREVASANRHRTPIGVIMIYPDQVKSILEARGRHAVEQLLWELGQRIPKYIRTEDIPCRYEGETFCIILPGADLYISQDRAEKIRREIEGLEISYGNILLSTTLSIGIATMPQNANTAQGLIGDSLTALHTAIKDGKNRVVVAPMEYR